MKRVSAWIVARGGVSRLALVALAAGLGIAGLRPPPRAAGLAGAYVLLGVLAGVVVVAGGVGGRRWRRWHSESPASSALQISVPFLVIVLALVAGFCLGSARMVALLDGELARAAAGPGGTFQGDVVVTGRPQERGPALVATVRSRGPSGPGEEVLLEVVDAARRPASTTMSSSGDQSAPELFDEGAVLRLEGRLRLPQAPTAGGAEGGFDEARWLRQQGVAVVLRASTRDIRVVGARTGLWGLLDRLRRRARAHLARGLDPGMAGLLQGFILGDKSGIPEPTLIAFRRAGTAHLLAVSGLHVGSLAAAVLLGARLAGAPPLARTVAAGTTAVSFMLLTGAGSSVVRATVMVFALLAANLAGRGRDGWTALALAAAVVLVREPPALGSVAFQLSFSAVAALLLVARPLEEKLARRLPAPLATGMGVSLAASLGTAPVSILTFGQASLVGVLANPLVVPVVPVVMAVGTGSVLVGFVVPAACGVLNTVAGTVIGWVTIVSAVFARAPVLSVQSLPSATGALAGGCFAWLAWLRAGRSSGRGRRRVSRARQPAPTLVLIGIVAVGAVCGVVVASGVHAGAARAELWRAGREWPEGGEVRVLDVGEGAAVLVRSPGRAAVLIDAGPPGQGVAGQLRRLGVGRLDALVITHPHADHYGGFAEAVDVVSPRVLVDQVLPIARPTTVSGEAAAYLDVQESAFAEGAHHLVPRSGDAVEVGDLRLEFLAPALPLASRSDGGWRTAVGVQAGSQTASPEGWTEGWAAPADALAAEMPALTSEQLNQASLVVVVRLNGLAILVPGDAEADVLARYPLPDVDALVVPHHGSDGAVTVSVLDRLTPTVAVVPVGVGNTFGHPSEQTIRLLGRCGSGLFRTDRSGWVSLRPAGGGAVLVAAER